MKAVNFWRTLLFSVMAFGAFTGCSNDDSEEEGGIPSITVNGEKSTSVALDYEGGTTSEIEVVSTGSWTLTFSDASASWCTPSVVSGNKGTTKLTFSAEATTVDREITATLATSGSIEGIPMEAKATIVIKQNAGGVAPSDALYIENCGEDVKRDGDYWPYTDQFTGWSRKGSLDQSDVAYSGSSASVRNSGVNYAPSDEERGVVSDAPYVYMTSSSNNFRISGINVGSANNFTFTFTAQVQASYGSGPQFATVTPDMLRLAVSVDEGASYLPAAFTASQVAGGSWYLCTAEFKLPATASTDKISIRFDSFAYAKGEAEQLRIDDFTLYEGGNGAELQPETVQKVTIDQITETGTYEVADAQVVGLCERGFVMQDATGVFFVYTPATYPALGNKVSVSGEVTLYGSNLQFASPTVTVTDNGTDYTLPTPTEVTADNVATIAGGKPQFVKFTCDLTVDGNYYNFTFPFSSSYTGSLAYPGDTAKEYNGKTIDITGWYVYTVNSKYFYVVASSISENTASVSGSFTDTPKTFAATSPEAQTLAFTASEAAGAVSFALTGENADKFSYDYTAGETKVTVSAKGDNTSDAAYKATLQLKAADGTVLDEVELVQAKPVAEGATVLSFDFTGNYPEGVPTADYEKETKTFTFSGYDFTFVSDGSNGYKFIDYLIFGKSGAYVQLPAIEGKVLTKVVVTSRKGASGSVMVGIADVDGNFVGGGDPIKWEQVDPYTYTYNLTGTTANTPYCIRVNSKHNAQITTLELTYE